MTAFAPARPEDEQVISSFPAYQGSGTKGFITNFLGVKTRTQFHNMFPGWDGLVESVPLPANCHATSLEWAGALRAVLEANERLVAVELGAGWAPWLVSLATAAQQRGVRQVHLVGVEGSQSHFDFMRTHFLDNELDPDQHQLLHAVVGKVDGQAQFPVLPDPSVHWGTAAIYSDSANVPSTALGKAMRRLRTWASPKRRFSRNSHIPGTPPCDKAVEHVDCYSLNTLLRPLAAVDLLHVDIQGAEADVLLSAERAIRSKVKRIVVGTHGRDIEMQLLNGLARQGWLLEADEACVYVQQGTEMTLLRDGCQVWKNSNGPRR